MKTLLAVLFGGLVTWVCLAFHYRYLPIHKKLDGTLLTVKGDRTIITRGDAEDSRFDVLCGVIDPFSMISGGSSLATMEKQEVCVIRIVR